MCSKVWTLFPLLVLFGRGRMQKGRTQGRNVSALEPSNLFKLAAVSTERKAQATAHL